MNIYSVHTYAVDTMALVDFATQFPTTYWSKWYYFRHTIPTSNMHTIHMWTGEKIRRRRQIQQHFPKHFFGHTVFSVHRYNLKSAQKFTKHILSDLSHLCVRGKRIDEQKSSRYNTFHYQEKRKYHRLPQFLTQFCYYIYSSPQKMARNFFFL